MHTVYTAPNGTADVITVSSLLLAPEVVTYGIRTRDARGNWACTGQVYQGEAGRELAQSWAREIDRFRPDGMGRFPVRTELGWKAA